MTDALYRDVRNVPREEKVAPLGWDTARLRWGVAPGKVFRLDGLLSLTQPRLGHFPGRKRRREEEEEKEGGRGRGGGRGGGIVSAGQRAGLAAQERSLRSQNRALRMGQRPEDSARSVPRCPHQGKCPQVPPPPGGECLQVPPRLGGVCPGSTH